MKIYQFDTNIDNFCHFLYFAPPPCWWKLNLGLKDIGSETIRLSDMENFEFDTNIHQFWLFFTFRNQPPPFTTHVDRS